MDTVAEPEIILRSIDTGKSIKLKTTVNRESNDYFGVDEYRFTATGRITKEEKSKAKKPAEEYEVMIRWPWTMSLGLAECRVCNHLPENLL